MKRNLPFSRIVICFAAFVSVSYGIVEADWVQTVGVSELDNGFGLPIDASAVVSFDAASQQLTITLDNLIVDPKAVNQNLTGFFLSFTTGESVATPFSSAGITRTVGGGRDYVDGSSVSTGWALINNALDPLYGTVGLHLDLLSAGGTVPEHTIIGLPGANNLYNNANGSIVGNGAHNPFLAESATFVLDIPGLGDASRVSTATFQFNTAAGTYSGVGIPEPSTFAILGLCLGCLSLTRSRRGSKV